MSDLMNFKMGRGQGSGFTSQSGASSKQTLVREDARPPIPTSVDPCSEFYVEIDTLRRENTALRSQITTLSNQPSSSSFNFTIPTGVSFVGYSGANGLSFVQAFNKAYVSGGGFANLGTNTIEGAKNSLFAKNELGKIFWGQYNFNNMGSLKRGEGLFMRNFGQPIVVDWSKAL